mmetsp:Transcript_2592/g.5421  ORF Transcript_2592/g.5421 Transcript_2592/m.5421 type:complete len:262 (-) Transcript_2592:289-1074(-)
MRKFPNLCHTTAWNTSSLVGHLDGDIFGALDQNDTNGSGGLGAVSFLVPQRGTDRIFEQFHHHVLQMVRHVSEFIIVLVVGRGTIDNFNRWRRSAPFGRTLFPHQIGHTFHFLGQIRVRLNAANCIGLVVRILFKHAGNLTQIRWFFRVLEARIAQNVVFRQESQAHPCGKETIQCFFHFVVTFGIGFCAMVEFLTLPNGQSFGNGVRDTGSVQHKGLQHLREVFFFGYRFGDGCAQQRVQITNICASHLPNGCRLAETKG